ncbi:hypothetical protein BD413DRAFT_22112 [Trametes elegans]|nr:hypothetical protein BD413DRAFT_22112 [Trametes elegans]
MRVRRLVSAASGPAPTTWLVSRHDETGRDARCVRQIFCVEDPEDWDEAHPFRSLLPSTTPGLLARAPASSVPRIDNDEIRCVPPLPRKETEMRPGSNAMPAVRQGRFALRQTPVRASPQPTSWLRARGNAQDRMRPMPNAQDGLRYRGTGPRRALQPVRQCEPPIFVQFRRTRRPRRSRPSARCAITGASSGSSACRPRVSEAPSPDVRAVVASSHTVTLPRPLLRLPTGLLRPPTVRLLLALRRPGTTHLTTRSLGTHAVPMPHVSISIRLYYIPTPHYLHL